MRWNASGPAGRERPSNSLGRVALGRVALTASFVHRLFLLGVFPLGGLVGFALTLRYTLELEPRAVRRPQASGGKLGP